MERLRRLAKRERQQRREAFEQQTATSEVLRVISRSPTDLQPVFEAILKSATELCDAHLGVLNLYDGKRLRSVARRGGSPAFAKFLVERGAFKPDGEVVLRSLAERRPVQAIDLRKSRGYLERRPNSTKFVELGRVRTFLSVPLVKDDQVVGNIGIYRPKVRRFADKQIDLVETFANQAVIAIENARLFNETRQALEHQQAASEILRIVATSVESAEPVFEAITKAGMRLIPGARVALMLVNGGELHYASHSGVSDERRAALARHFPMPLDKGFIAGATVLGKQTIHVADFAIEAALYPRSVEVAKSSGYQAMLSIPLMHGGDAIGVLAISRETPGAFSDRQIVLFQMFADHAVVAIENARLFNETKAALERQTATADVLKVISASPTDVRPVFDAVAKRAAQLCNAMHVVVLIADGEALRVVAKTGVSVLPFSELPMRRTLLLGRAFIDGQTVHTEDVVPLLDNEYPDAVENQRKVGFRSFLAIPMKREDRAIGVIGAWRPEVKPFSAPEIELLETFAAQAVIAIENVRLFNETKEALDQQKASAEVLGVISGSVADTRPVFEKILESCERLFNSQQVGVMLVGEDGWAHALAFHDPVSGGADATSVPINDESATGRAILSRQVVHFPDVLGGTDVPPHLRANAKKFGIRSVLFAPMLWEGRGIGALYVEREVPGAFSEKAIRLLKTFADQAVIAIQNARLFREIQEKSAQLEIANKHKSDFLANMSHELRTPLNAIIGFSEALMDSLFGELNEKQLEYQKDIHESGKHLLSLINDILDLSKIEAGRMELELSSFHLPTAVSNAVTLIRERAQRHGIALGVEVDSRLGEFQADERKVKQILLNLLSNAVKFTPDGGRVDVSAKLDTDKVEITVKDTGVGISLEDQASLFEEFKQFGKDSSRKAEGTGLGLALTKRLVELHGGQIAVDSAVGRGSTFRVAFPIRH